MDNVSLEKVHFPAEWDLLERTEQFHATTSTPAALLPRLVVTPIIAMSIPSLSRIQRCVSLLCSNS